MAVRFEFQLHVIVMSIFQYKSRLLSIHSLSTILLEGVVIRLCSEFGTRSRSSSPVPHPILSSIHIRGPSLPLSSSTCPRRSECFNPPQLFQACSWSLPWSHNIFKTFKAWKLITFSGNNVCKIWSNIYNMTKSPSLLYEYTNEGFFVRHLTLDGAIV